MKNSGQSHPAVRYALLHAPYGTDGFGRAVGSIQNTTGKNEEEYRFILMSLYLRADSTRATPQVCDVNVARREDIDRLFTGYVRRI